MKRPSRGAIEYDAFTHWRRRYRWRAGELRKIKRRASKRDRRQVQAEIRSGTD